MTPEEALSHFLDALDTWGCEYNDERATEITAFLDGGCDLGDYEKRPELTVIGGARPLQPKEPRFASEFQQKPH